MVRSLLLCLPLLFLFSCKDNFIGDPSKNITPGSTNQSSDFPSELLASWYSSSGTLTYSIGSASQFWYNSIDYAVIKITVSSNVYKVIAQSLNSNLYYTFFFTDISAGLMRAQRSGSYTTSVDAESATEGPYSQFNTASSSSWNATSFPSVLNTGWYSTSGTLTYTISGSNSILYNGSMYTVVATAVNGSVYRIIARFGSSSYYAFYFSGITSLSMSAYRSGGYSSQSDAESSSAGTYTAYSSQAPNPWTSVAFPTGLIKSWNTTGGSLAYTISSSSAITYSTTTYTVIASYNNGTKYKIIVRSPSPSNLYFAFFFDNVTSSGMTSYRSGSYSTQSAAEAATEGTHTTYVAATAWTAVSFPYTANGGWYKSGSLTFLFYNSQYVYWGSSQLYFISAGLNGSTYRIIMKINGGSYYVFFFTNLSSSNANIHVSSAKATLSDAQAAVPGSYSAYSTPWLLTTFPTALNGNWYTSSNLYNYGIVNGSTIQTNNVIYTIVATYRQGSVYKVLTSRGSNYHTFHFKDITSTQMYVHQASGVSSYLTAFVSAQGTYLYHKK